LAKYEEILKTILDVAGNPASGVIADLAPEWAKAIAELDAPAVEKRVVEAPEKR
jgi:hypothetical protein